MLFGFSGLRIPAKPWADRLFLQHPVCGIDLGLEVTLPTPHHALLLPFCDQC